MVYKTFQPTKNQIKNFNHSEMPKNKDSLFDVEQICEDFIFNEQVARVFDDMLDRSVPFYQEVIHSIARILASTLESNAHIVDLGCSTGTTLLHLSNLLADKNFHYTGIDNSQAMLDRANRKAKRFPKQQSLTFIQGDIMKVRQPSASAFILNYTLQFIRPLNREKFLARLFSNLQPGGIIILSEKVISKHPGLNRKFIDIYHQFKKERGYSELEITKKREALENILIPCSTDENRSMLQSAGFVEIETFFQWFNFVSFLAVKPTS